ncbi:DsrE/DsrF-like family protein [Pseudobythopirellula maris]|uniref:DsrE/DsrF-like family protein n=1 Tax=Pseudobythopirellula maris TaxID=2527991 RepID=A0A5C5ZSX2_9BACT|nr:DsrE family protein [Pseudobythopirellula maris]TWT90350.1 DsrE/DsrF-like family protein [Pseudobythopirellula maris]
MKFHAILTVAMLAVTTAFADPTGDPQYKHPVIENHGGIVVLPEAAHQPKRKSKVILDITSDGKSGSVVKGFDRAALILNQYTQAKAGWENGFKMAIILHGSATKAALSHEGFAKHTNSYLTDKGKTKNPNLELMAGLKKAGVEIFVCGQALAHHGYATNEVASEAKVAVSAATLNISLQMEGYAYLPFH